MERQISIERLGRLKEEIPDRGAIKPRSRCDPAAIVAHLASIKATILPTDGTRSDGGHLRTKITINARSWPDRGSFEAKARLIHRQFGSHDAAQGNRSHDAINPLPRPHQSATIFGPIFSLKKESIYLCSSTLDRFVKVIKRISRKILSSS